MMIEILKVYPDGTEEFVQQDVPDNWFTSEENSAEKAEEADKADETEAE